MTNETLDNYTCTIYLASNLNVETSRNDIVCWSYYEVTYLNFSHFEKNPFEKDDFSTCSLNSQSMYFQAKYYSEHKVRVVLSHTILTVRKTSTHCTCISYEIYSVKVIRHFVKMEISVGIEIGHFCVHKVNG